MKIIYNKEKEILGNKRFALDEKMRIRKSKSFDPKKIFIKKAGKVINVYDSIQAANVDTDIYKTLEKYGSIEPMNKYNEHSQLNEQFCEYMSLMDLHEQRLKAQDMWNALPAGVRAIFHNDQLEFLQRGQQWAQEQIALAKANKPQEPKPTKGEENV